MACEIEISVSAVGKQTLAEKEKEQLRELLKELRELLNLRGESHST